MFSFLDTSLYGEGRSCSMPQGGGYPQASTAAALQQASAATFAAQQRPSESGEAPAQLAQPAAQPVDQTQLMYNALEALQAKLAHAEKRSLLSEQRLLSALQETQTRLSRVDEERLVSPRGGGCSWSALLLVVCAFVSIFFLTRGFNVSAQGASLPVMMPSTLPASPLVMPLAGGGIAAPSSFLRST